MGARQVVGWPGGEDLGNPSREVPGGPRTSKRRPGCPTRGPQSPGEGRSPERMGSRPPETGADPGASPGEIELRTQWPQAFPAGMKSRDPSHQRREGERIRDRPRS